jgi:hypothetical protein
LRVDIRWHDEEVPKPGGGGTYVRQVAWIVGEDVDGEGVRYLAYLGANPSVTKDLKLEFDALYPDLDVDWQALESLVEKPKTKVHDLSYDELALRLRSILGEHGYEMDAIDTEFGGGWHRPLKELERLLSNPAVTARFERTSGSVFRYLSESHPDYAYAVLKVRLLLESRTAALNDLVRSESELGKGGKARERRDFYVKALQYHVDGG